VLIDSRILKPDNSFIRLLSCDDSLPVSEQTEVKRLVFSLGLTYVFFGLVRVSLRLLVAVGLFYLLVKLAGLPNAMTEAKRARSRTTSPQAEGCLHRHRFSEDSASVFRSCLSVFSLFDCYERMKCSILFIASSITPTGGKKTVLKCPAPYT